MDTALSESTREARAPPGYWMSIPVSSRCTAIRPERKLATTPPGEDGQAIRCIPTGSATCAWCSMSKSKAARPASQVQPPRLRQWIERLAPEERPALVRGDNAFGMRG